MDWIDLPNAIEPRVEGHSAVIDGKIYIFGGFQTQNIVPTDQNEIYDPAANAWSTFEPLPVPNTHVGSAEADGKVWIAGGYALIGFIQTVDVVWIYDPVTDTFTDGPSLPAPRAGGALVRLGRKLHYISGLENRNDSVGDHFVLDLDEPGGPQTWTTAAPMPDPRNHFSGIALGGKIYAIGGQFNHDIDPVDTALVHEYDPVTDSWSRKADLPFIRSHFEPGTIAVDGKIIIAGGRTGTQNCTDKVTEYNPATDTWTELFTMPSCRLAPSAKIIDEEMFLSHGGVVSVLFPTTEAHKRDFDRSISAEMAFTPSNKAIALAPGETEVIEPILWTLSEAANYSISLAGLPSWISNIAKSAGTADQSGDEIDITINTNGLAPGLYTHTFTATASGYNDATLTIQVTVSGDGEPILGYSPASIDLGSVPVGYTHHETLTLSNTGSGTATFGDDGLTAGLLNLAVTGGAVDVMMQPSEAITQLAPSQSTTLDVYITMLESGEASGTASFPYFSDGEETSVALSFSGSASGTRIARINAGGAALSPGEFDDWDADAFFEAGKSFSNGAVTTIDGTLDEEPYKSERSAQTNLGSFAYRIPVPAPGHYIARLHFAETFFGAPGGSIDFIGRRVFDVNLEGGPIELDDYDIAADVGPVTATVKSFTMEVLDGVLDIDFSASVDQPKISAIEVFQVDQASHQSLSDGWNLVSLPTIPSSSDPDDIYADISLAQAPFVYEGNSYVQKQSMSMGTGYWLKSNGIGYQAHPGTSDNDVTVSMQSGWNMIGGPSCAAPIADATGATGILLTGTAYSYSAHSGYSIVDVLQPGQGYWIQTSGAGSVTFVCGAGKAGTSTTRVASDERLPENALTLTLIDALQNERLLFISKDVQSEALFNLPPVPPSHQPDVRFLNSSSLMNADQALIKLQAMQAPITVSLSGNDPSISYDLSVERGDEWEVLVTIASGESVVIDEPDMDRMLISEESDALAALPDEFSLRSAYPNPFQQQLTVSFDAPEDGMASIEMFDMLGKRVWQSEEVSVSAGTLRTIGIDAQSLASGAYMYRLSVQTATGTQTATGRAVLIR